eukprot:jgi/Galph1/3073/GphlegSOOS_G1711.1
MCQVFYTFYISPYNNVVSVQRNKHNILFLDRGQTRRIVTVKKGGKKFTPCTRWQAISTFPSRRSFPERVELYIRNTWKRLKAYKKHCLVWNSEVFQLVVKKCVISAILCIFIGFVACEVSKDFPLSRLLLSSAAYSPVVSTGTSFGQSTEGLLDGWITSHKQYSLMNPSLASPKDISLSVFGFVAISLFMIQDHLIYKPSREFRGAPEDFGLSFYDNVALKTKDGVEIYGWLIKRHEDYVNAPTIVVNPVNRIYFHGADKNNSFRLVKAYGYYVNLRCNILLVSYRGFGNSKGQPTEKGLCLDADAMFEYLQQRKDIDQNKLFVYGESLGGAVAIYLTEKYQNFLKCMVIENTFTSLFAMMGLAHPLLSPFKWLAQNQWPSIERIGRVRLPILFLSGLRDSFVPPIMMKELYEAAKHSSYKILVPFQHGTHNRTWILDGYYDTWTDFLKIIFEKDYTSSLANMKEGDVDFVEEDV